MNLLYSRARWRSSNPLHVFKNCDPHSSALRVHLVRKMALAPKSAALAGNSSSVYVDLGAIRTTIMSGIRLSFKAESCAQSR
jgi:hypothetical protein